MSVKCEEPLDELTVQVWLLYLYPIFNYWTLFISGAELRTDRRTDKQMDGRSKHYMPPADLSGRGHKNYGTMWKVLSLGIHTWNSKALCLMVLKLWPMLTFFIEGQTSRSRSQDKKLWQHVKGLVMKKTHVNMKALPLMVFNLWPMLKFFKSRSNFKVNVTR